MRAVWSSLVGLTWLMAATPALSHHSFAAVFDINRPVELTGTVTRLEWTNPHAWIYVDVEDADGNVVNWALETRAANNLIRLGWRPQDLPVGSTLVVDPGEAAKSHAEKSRHDPRVADR